MKIITRVINFKYIFILLLVVFLATRLLNLGILPIFNDESTYIRYGIHQLKEADGRFYSLMVGKEPLLPYLFAQAGSISGNLLISARIISIAFGFLAFSGIFMTTKLLFEKTTAVFASVFYIFCPYTLFFDRLAVMESAVSVISIWTLYFTLKYFESFKKINIIWLGFIAGIGTWIKTPDFFYVFLPLIYGVAMYLLMKEKKKESLLVGAGTILALLVFLPLYLNPLYKVHLELLSIHTYPMLSVFIFPVHVWFLNLKSAFIWLFLNMTPLLFSLSAAGIYYSIKMKKNLILFLWLFLPLTYEILYSRNFGSRHTLLLAIPLIIFASFSVSILIKKYYLMMLGLLFLIFSIFIFHDYFIWFHPLKLPESYIYRGSGMDEYVHGFSSGFGVMEAVNYLKSKKERGPINIVIRNDHGNPEDAMAAYFSYDDKVGLSIFDKPYERLKTVKDQTPYPVYFVSRGSQFGGLEKYFKDSKIFKKPDDPEFIGVYEIDMKSL